MTVQWLTLIANLGIMSGVWATLAFLVYLEYIK